MARRTKDEANETRDAILNAAEKMFYARGVSRTTLEQIARAAGVTRGAVYWHFKDKLELCTVMTDRIFLPYEDMLKELVEQTADAPLQALKKACLHSLKMMASDKRRQNIVSILTLRCEYVEEMIGVMERRNQCKNRMLEASEKVFARAKKMKTLAPCWTPRKAALTLQALMTGLITCALEKPKEFGFSTTCIDSVEAFFSCLQVQDLK